MNRKTLLLPILSALTVCCGKTPTDLVQENLDFAANQMRISLAKVDQILHSPAMEADNPKFMPRSLEPDGSVYYVSARDWTSGFFPGSLWYMYEYTGNRFWKDEAMRMTLLLEEQQHNKGTHDLGFMINNSFGHAWRLTGDTLCRDVTVTTAYTLTERFNPVVGSILSWNPRKGWTFPVIIDNMMNLELLFNAAEITGDSSLYRLAVTHANTTLMNHFREDDSSWHVVDYDPQTGAVLNKHTHQGFSHESSWARGQAWGLYGYTSTYRYTCDKRYLDQAEKIAQRIFTFPSMPADLMPYWDFDAPHIPDEPRDVSAAAIIASALYELSTFGTPDAEIYKAHADAILENLTRSYRIPPGGGHGFLLTGSTGNKPGNHEIDTPLNYADYYFLESLLRKNKIEKLENQNFCQTSS